MADRARDGEIAKKVYFNGKKVKNKENDYGKKSKQ